LQHPLLSVKPCPAGRKEIEPSGNQCMNHLGSGNYIDKCAMFSSIFFEKKIDFFIAV
jgi:hypothetical protein